MPALYNRLSRFRQHSFVSGVLAISLFSPHLCRSAQVEYDLIHGGQTVAQIAYVTDRNLFVKALGGDKNRDLAFDAKEELLLIIDHSRQSYIQIDNPTIDEVAAVMKSVSQKMGSSSEVVTGILQNLGISVADNDITTTATGSKLTVGGYPCHLYRATAAEQLVAEICVAEETALPLSSGEVVTLQRFIDFGSRMMLRADKLLAVLGLQLPPLSIDHRDGLPIAVYNAKDDTEVRLSTITAAAPPVTPGLPAAYTRTRIPFVTP